MTSAAELFYNRRSRFGRSDPDFALDSSPGRISHHHGVHNRRHHHHLQSGSSIRRDRLDVTDCEPLRASPRRPSRFAPPDRESILIDSGSSHATSGDVSHAENNNRTRDRLRTSSGSERLPGAVLLARERLLERLRGVSISGNRQSSRTPASNYRNNFTFEDDFRLADAGNWETDVSRDWLAGMASGTDSLWRGTNMRPPGLSQEALSLLHIEVFSYSEKEEKDSQASPVLECSICLDAFLEGDKLICLPCGHRFHPCCLEPWVRTCGDCPYCRAAVLVTSSRAKGRSLGPPLARVVDSGV